MSDDNVKSIMAKAAVYGRELRMKSALAAMDAATKSGDRDGFNRALRDFGEARQEPEMFARSARK